MQVKNYIVDNYQVLINCLEEELCKKEILNWFFSKIENYQVIISEKTCEDFEFLLTPHNPNDLVLVKDIMNVKKETLYYHMNKSKQKQNSHKVKHQIKRYSR